MFSADLDGDFEANYLHLSLDQQSNVKLMNTKDKMDGISKLDSFHIFIGRIFKIL